MTAELFKFPARPEERRQARLEGPPPPLAQSGEFVRRATPGRRTYSFADVCALLSLVGRQRTMIGFLRDLHTQCHMPVPKNPRRWGGSLLQGPAAIDSRSVWCAMEFDAWLDSRRSPPPAHLAADVPPLPPLARADMAARAAQLAGR